MTTNTKAMTVAEFLSTRCLPALSRRGADYANDVTLAARIRAELNAAVVAGVFPVGTKFSVRINHHSSLTVQIVAWEGPVFSDDYAAHVMDPTGTPMPRSDGMRYDSRITEALNSALSAMLTIADRHNFDESRIEEDYFHVGYYLTVNAGPVESHAMHGLRLESDPAFAALVEKAHKAAKIVGKKFTKSVLGRTSIEAAGEWSLNKLVEAAERYGCELVYSARLGWKPAGVRIVNDRTGSRLTWDAQVAS